MSFWTNNFYLFIERDRESKVLISPIMKSFEKWSPRDACKQALVEHGQRCEGCVMPRMLTFHSGPSQPRGCRLAPGLSCSAWGSWPWDPCESARNGLENDWWSWTKTWKSGLSGYKLIRTRWVCASWCAIAVSGCNLYPAVFVAYLSFYIIVWVI